jgi:hypothetical protein
MLLLLSTIAAAAPPAWVEFDRRPAGWQDSPFEYDQSSVRRMGQRVRTTYRHKTFLSGVPDPEFRVGIEIDCARRRTRVYRSDVLNLTVRTAPPSRRRTAPASQAPTPIAPGSVEEALARRLCPGASAATP